MMDVNNHLHRRAALMWKRNISLVLDVGANVGQFAKTLRLCGYKGRIVSFEPLKNAFAALQRTAAGDPLWECRNCAVGDVEGSSTINISANSHSSSLLPVNPRSLKIEPSIAYIGKEPIEIRRLDRLLPELAGAGDRIYLKVDTQGYEERVVRGAAGVLDRIELIQLEASFFPVYEGEVLVGKLIQSLDELGYRIVGLEPGWYDSRKMEMLQGDFIFARKFSSDRPTA